MFLSILFFVTGLLGFLTFTVVAAQYSSNRKVNAYFLILIFFASSRFFLFGVNVLIPFSVNDAVGLFFRSFGCVVFPCIYLYFKNLIANKKEIAKEDLVHFVVPVLLGFLNLFIKAYLEELRFYFCFLFSGIALFYVFLSYVELKNNVWFGKSKHIVIESQHLLLRNWTIFFFILFALSVLRLVLTLFLDIYVAGYSDGTNFLWLTAILNCILFFKVLMTPVVLHTGIGTANEIIATDGVELVFSDFWNLSAVSLIQNSQDLKLKERIENNLEFYIYEIERLALRHFCFRNPSVSMSDFAIKLEIPKSHLIYFFKYHSNVSFIEFKRTVRIYDAIGLIEGGFLESGTLETLSEKTGFSSYDLFLDSFKEISGVLPKEYIQKIKEIC